MAKMKMVVLLMMSTTRSPVGLRSAAFYDNYFFNLQTGIAGFWFEQTAGNIELVGDVKPWLSFGMDPNFDNRDDMAARARQSATDAYKTPSDPDPLAAYEFVVTVVASPLDSNGNPRAIHAGSAGSNVVMSVGDPFDFVAHEVGHQLGLTHSFDESGKLYDRDHRPGEYGHGYCIMSARAYGDVGSNRGVPPWGNGLPEYAGYGPGLSAATRVDKGWLPVQSQSVSATPQEVKLSSVGDPTAWNAKALEITDSSSRRHIVSYRSADDFYDFAARWDAVVVELIDSGPAETANPQRSAATMKGIRKLPLDMAGPSQYVTPDFEFEIAHWNRADRTVTLRIATWLPRQLGWTKGPFRDLGRHSVATGNQSFAEGEVLCVAGNYDWELFHQALSITYEVASTVEPPIEIEWKLGGQLLTSGAGAVSISERRRVFPPIPFGKESVGACTVRYEIGPTNRITLFNDPASGNFQIELTAQVSASAGQGELRDWIFFKGQVVQMSDSFKRDQQGCLAERASRARRQMRRRIMLPGEIWRRATPENIDRVRDLMDIISQASGADERTYSQAMALLGDLFDTTALRLQVHEPATTGSRLLAPSPCDHPGRPLR